MAQGRRKVSRRLAHNIKADQSVGSRAYGLRSFSSVANDQRLGKFCFAKLEKSDGRGRNGQDEHFPHALGEQYGCYDRSGCATAGIHRSEGILFPELTPRVCGLSQPWLDDL